MASVDLSAMSVALDNSRGDMPATCAVYRSEVAQESSSGMGRGRATANSHQGVGSAPKPAALKGKRLLSNRAG